VKPNLSVFLLAYNEEENIFEAIDESLKVLGGVAGKYEVLVVLYEGSRDKTREIVEKLSEKHSQIRLVTQPNDEAGYGAALRIGFESAQYPLIFYTDADNQFNIHELKEFVSHIEGGDLVVGFRVNRKDPPGRILAAKAYGLLIRLVFGLKVRDVDCAFKLVKKEVFEKVRLSCGTGMGDAELLVKAKKHGFKIVELPVSHLPRKKGEAVFHQGGMGFVKPKVVFNLLKDMFKLKKEIMFS